MRPKIVQTVSTLTKKHEILYATIILPKEQIKIDTYVELGRNFFKLQLRLVAIVLLSVEW